MSKKDIHLFIEEDIWLKFKADCIRNKLVPSNIVELYMKKSKLGKTK